MLDGIDKMTPQYTKKLTTTKVATSSANSFVLQAKSFWHY